MRELLAGIVVVAGFAMFFGIIAVGVAHLWLSVLP